MPPPAAIADPPSRLDRVRHPMEVPLLRVVESSAMFGQTGRNAMAA
jgi:hypothetical protein